MRKSGLQKQIAFIFDEVPKPQADPAASGLPIQQVEDVAAATCTQDTPSLQDSTDQTQTSKPQQMAAMQTQAVHTPAVSTLRPKPLPKVQFTAPKQKTSEVVMSQVKKMLYGSSKTQMDPRQKKMTILVGALAVVFAGVLVVSLGGLGQSSAKAANKDDDIQSTAKPQQADISRWQNPQPVPEQLRNPMIPQASRPVENDETPNISGPMRVTGIVFSKDNPSAIINGEIVKQGGTIDGATVLSITKDSVEFEKDGKPWTQKVRR